MTPIHQIKDITIDENHITLMVDGKVLKLALDTISPNLKFASSVERSFYKISHAGYGIHWPLIDEDLSVHILLKLALAE